MDGVRICIISPPAFDESTAALFIAWIAGDRPERLHSIARDYYENGPLPTNTNYIAIEASAKLEQNEEGGEENGLDTTGTSVDATLEEHSEQDWEDGENSARSDRRRDTDGGAGDSSSPAGGSAGGAGGDGSGVDVVISHAAKHELVGLGGAPDGGEDTSKRHQLVFRRKRNCYVDATSELIKSAVNDDIRTFEALEHYLCAPTLLRSQTMIQIYSLKMQSFVIERYWALDDVVVREVVVGSKRLTRSRKDLDDVSESTGISLRSVTRQFDNLKRLYTAVEDNERCNLFDFVQRSVLLKPELSRKYACILFLLYSKFTLTSKKRMTRVNLSGLEKCAALTLACLVSDCSTFFRVGKAAALGDGGGMQPDGSGECGIFGSLPSILSLSSVRSHSTSVSSASSPSPTPTGTAGNNISNGGNDNGASNKTNHSSRDNNNGIGAAGMAEQVSSPQGGSGPDQTDDAMCALMATGEVAYCWSLVWNVFSYVEAVDPDKQLMSNLRDIKTALTGDTLNMGCQHVTSSLMERSGGAIVKKLEGARLRTVLKAIMQIGANLSQTREYRDFFEDILTKVAEPLEEAGLSLADMNAFLICCASVIKAIPESHRTSSLSASTAKVDKLDRKKDWARFVLCCRLVLIQLVQGSV